MSPSCCIRGLAIVLVVAAAWGKPAEAQPETPPQTLREKRDPTSPGPKLKEAMTSRQPGAELGVVVLRARVIAKGQTPVALLEMNGRIFAVTKGGLIVGSPYVVADINVVEVRLENQASKEVLVLR